MMGLIIGTITILSLTAPSMAYSSGCYIRACQDMTPGHTGRRNNETIFTASLSTEESCYTADTPIKMSLKDDTEFLGFSLQVRRAGTQDRAEGAFSAFDQHKFKLLNCAPGEENYFTTKSSVEKTEATLSWTAASNQGDLDILYTFVRNYTTFWPKRKIELKQC